MTRFTHSHLVRLATAYDEDDETTIEFSLPENLSDLDQTELNDLHEQAREAFDALYNGDRDLTSDEVEAMAALADAVEAIRAELTVREQTAAEARATADALAARINPVAEDGDGGDEGADEGEDGDDGGDADEDAAPAEVEGDDGDDEGAPAEAEDREPALVAGNRPIQVTVRGVQPRVPANQPEVNSDRPVILAAADVPGFSSGQELTLEQVAAGVEARSRSVNPQALAAANRAGTDLYHRLGVASVHKPIEDELVASGSDATEVLHRVADESRLPGGSLVASGGWCAPSETLYDLFSLETNSGLVSLPTMGVRRGGINFTAGPDFSTIFSNVGFGPYTEAEDIAGDYNGSGGGTKPCYKVECPTFTDLRLDLQGVCIKAGILQNSAYPELTRRVVSGALIAHEHKVAGEVITTMVAGSTAVAMPAGQIGATAPILTAVELQVLDYRNRHRMGLNASLEAIFPHWVHGAVRADLSRRLGVDLLSVSDAQINGWFTQRGVNPQFVYNWQDGVIGGGAVTGVNAFPTTASFLIYAAGTWVKGEQAVITLDAVFDAAEFEVNDYTALFTEEGYLVAKRGHDSRVVSVPICVDGATHIGVAIACDGTAG